MKKTNIARMVWPEVQEAAERNAVVMVPLASVEPSGRHAVMGGELFIADYFVEAVARRTGSVCVPTMPFGYAPNFMSFPGTITLQADTLVSVLLDVCRSLLKHGFDHILVVNNHTGNEPVVEQAARKFREETGVALAGLLLPRMMRLVAEDLYDDLGAIHGHGGEPGVSVRLYLCPDDMRMDLAVMPRRKPFQGLDVRDVNVGSGAAAWKLYVDYGETNPSGGEADPFNASAEKGKIVLERMIECGVDIVNAFRTVNTR